MDKIVEQILAWPYWDSLPQEIEGFQLAIEKEQRGTQYRLFSYRHGAQRKVFSVYYDAATKEFLARWQIGLLEFCDINFIAPNIAMLQQLLAARLEAALRSAAIFEQSALGSVFLQKKIVEWPFAACLPPAAWGFILCIAPSQPLKTINGSYIIIDYSDFDTRSNLLIYYNIYRDEFYGECVFRGTPRMTSSFDAKTLDELKEKLSVNLEPVLQEMRRELEQTKDYKGDKT
ncbi:MAG: hypothetical protein N2491_13150 [Negativicutes bacterium]|nr:hypothetical protein [Negativicutes bacterium]